MNPFPQLKPKRLYPGDTIGIIAPSSPGESELALAGLSWLKEQGFRAQLGATFDQTYGYLAGPDTLRAADIQQMFTNPDIDGIICLRGGYGSMRLLDLLDYEVIRANPKVFVGYSDITALHISIGQRTGLITFHGPMIASDMGKGITGYSFDSLFRTLTAPTPPGLITNPPYAAEPLVIVPGSTAGLLTGGNLSLLAATLGTPYEIDTAGKILCIEEVGEAPYRIDRMLTQLSLAGKLQAAAGIVFAVCADCDNEDNSPDFTLEEVLYDRLGGLKQPVLANLYFGHTPDKATLPFGLNASLETDQGGLIINETATQD